MRGRWLILLVIMTAGLLWLMRTAPTPNALPPLHEAAPAIGNLGEKYIPAQCGSLTCMVKWKGDRPSVKPLSLFQAKLRPNGKIEWPNPNAPRIGADNGIADCVVMLKGVDVRKSQPWNLPGVQIEGTQADYVVIQGNRRGRYGIVRRGSDVEFVARDASMQSARARGASFFQQMLFVPNQPVKRTLSDAGMVELSSGSGHFWMRAYLAVSDHPYVGITNEKGQVTFENVPEGSFELVCWKANWNIATITRDPEWLFQADLEYAAAIEKIQPIQVLQGTAQTFTFSLQASDFAPQ